MNPDSIMSRYWLERERRERGEHTGLRALAPLLSGIVSECHGSKVTTNRKGELVCTKCNGICDGQSWMAGKAEAQRGDGITTMYVQETRIIDSGAVDRLRADEADRFLQFERLAALIEPRPARMEARRWSYILHAYGWLMTRGAALAEQAGMTFAPNLGPWSESSIRRAADQGREILVRRLERPRTRRWHDMAGDREVQAILH